MLPSLPALVEHVGQAQFVGHQRRGSRLVVGGSPLPGRLGDVLLVGGIKTWLLALSELKPSPIAPPPHQATNQPATEATK
jgi:hypothetical protein